MVKRRHPRRGFTLIEMLVTSGVAIIMLSAALALFIQGIAQQQRQRKLAEMKRSAALVMGQLTTELRQAGLGRPRGARVGTGDRFPASILVAQPQQIIFIADLPRPNSTFNGFSQLAADQTPASFAGLSLLNELNGGCDVTTATPACATDLSSHLFTYAATSTATDCAGSSGTARTCPWALNRYQPSEYIIVADGMGRWVERQIGTSSTPPHPPSALRPDGRRALSIDASVPAELVSGGANQSFVSTPDRVFHRIIDGWWERKQCWGSVGSPIGTLSDPCAAGADGTDWERLARLVTPASITFRYFKANGDPLTAPVATTSLKDIARVDIELQLERPMTAGDPLRHTAHGSITLRQ
ncbi:PilW family protein [Archangium sp.]|jgi:type II secretory pathway pseudopilin PulG|uniref:PilW family protein n=1 Tax=Archangium sp. TaxID=1872627 RepID=UPI002EDA59D8